MDTTSSSDVHPVLELLDDVCLIAAGVGAGHDGRKPSQGTDPCLPLPVDMLTDVQRLDKVEAVLFDTFGTVVDWRRGVAAAVAQFAARRGVDLDAQAFALRWRSLYQPSMEPVRNGAREFVSLDVLHAENLRVVLTENDIDPDDVDPHRADSAQHGMAPAAAVAGQRCRTDRATQPGDDRTAVQRQPRAAGPDGEALGATVDVVIGSDVIRAYKPQPEAYQRAVALLGLSPIG